MGAEVTAVFEVTLEGLKLSLEGKFLLENSEESLLDVTREVIEATNSDSTSIEGNSSEAVVLTGEQHLEETKTKVNLSVENQKIESKRNSRLIFFPMFVYLLLE